MRTQILKPGLLVSLKSTLRGGVSYRTEDINPDHAEGDARVAVWKTERTIINADEHAAAVKARTAARGAILKHCRASSFGLLCPQSDETALLAGIAEARAIADAHNAQASCTFVDVFALIGRIAQSDEEASAAIASEVRSLLSDMESAVRAADPEAIRAAATKARALSGMLSDDVADKVGAAIAEVRRVARDIVKAAEKSADRAADAVEGVKLAALDAARFAVLDVDCADAADVETIEAAPAPALDLEPDDDEMRADLSGVYVFEQPAAMMSAPSIDWQGGF